MPGTVAILALAGFGVGLLVLFSLRFGFAGTPQLEDSEEAAAIANGLKGGFDVKICLMDKDRHCALLIDGQGRRAVIMPHGAHFIARPLSDKAQLSHDGHKLIILDVGLRAQLMTDSDCALAGTTARSGK